MTHIIASSRPRALLLGLLLTATVGCGDSSGGDTGESGATTENPGSSTAETGDTADATGTSADTPTTDDATSTTDDATSTTASTGEPTTGEPAGGPEIVVEFDPLIFQLPEGLDVRDGAAYVGIVSGYVLKIDLATKTVMPFGGFMGLPQDNTAIMTGLVVGPQGEVYLALDVFAPGDFTSGVYKIPAGGGDAEPFAADPALMFPNGFALDPKGDLLVTDSFGGGVFHVALADGVVTPWVNDAMFAPDPAVCNLATMFHLGANGIVHGGDRVLVTNSDTGSIIEVPVDAEGKPGEPSLYLGPDCEALAGADGLVIEPGTGDLLVPVNYRQRVIRVGADRSIEVLAQDGLLQSPATLVMAPGDDAVLIANAAFEATTEDPATAHPALLSLALD